MNLLEPQAGLPVSRELVAFALADDPAAPAVLDAIDRLASKRLIFKRAATGELCLWPHSSLDISAELARAKAQLPERERLGDIVRILPATRPVVAHRHYLERGTLRVAETLVVDSVDDALAQAQRPPRTGTDARIWVVVAYPQDDAAALYAEVARASQALGSAHLLAVRPVGADELSLAQELLAWRRVASECAELRVDAFARAEVASNVQRLTDELIRALTDLRLPEHGAERLRWWHAGSEFQVRNSRELNAALSDVFDRLYDAAPWVRNELINRTELSSQAAAARQRLLERMFTDDTKPDLGIEQTPPEKAIYLSVLKAAQMHVPVGGGWAFQAPAAGPGSWRSAWAALESMLETEGLIGVDTLIQRFAQPPFGMRESLTLILVAVFMRVHPHDLILRERGTYLTRVEGAHLQRLARRPESFELHMVAGRDAVRSVLGVYRDVLAVHLARPELPVAVGTLVRALYDWYLALPEHTLGTSELKTHHKAALALLGKSCDPVELLTIALPAALGIGSAGEPYEADTPVKRALLEASLTSLLEAASHRLDALREKIILVLAQALGLGQPEAIRPHLSQAHAVLGDELSDYALKSLLLRSSDGSRSQTQWIDSIASLLGGRALETWRDDTLFQFRAEAKRLATLLARLLALSAGECGAADMVALHVVGRDGRERFVTLPAGPGNALPEPSMQKLREALRAFPVPAYALATLLLEESSPTEKVA